MTLSFTVSDVRQYEYCARIVYFTHCVGMVRRRPTTYKMEEGLLNHDLVAELEERRTLKSYGLTSGERLFDVRLESAALGLRGLLDMLILTDDEAIPVEFKNSWNAQVGTNHIAQLTSYALMIEEQWGLPVKRAFVHFIPTKTSQQLQLDAVSKDAVRRRIASLSRMVEREAMPDATQVRGRCDECEFRNFCPDVW